MNNKQLYQDFCESGVFIPIFMQPWWLDLTCEKMGWNVAIVEKDNKIWGALPYYIKSNGIFSLITMPKLTKFMGPIIRYPQGQKYFRKLAWEKEIMFKLIEQIPLNDLYFQSWYYDYTNWLPFYWKGYKQRTNYSYYIPKTLFADKIENNYESDTRRRLKKAKSLNIAIIESNSVKDYFKLMEETFERKEARSGLELEFIQSLFQAIIKKNCGKLYLAVFEDNYIAAGLFVYDDRDFYYIGSGISKNYKDLGAMDLIIDHAIKFALSINRNFDFEGSMIESIENYFRRFGAIQRPFNSVYKINSLAIRTLYNLFPSKFKYF